jgi:valyl-tRNA synthetase
MCAAVVLFEFACLLRHGGNIRWDKEKIMSLEDEMNTLWNVHKYVATNIILVVFGQSPRYMQDDHGLNPNLLAI